MKKTLILFLLIFTMLFSLVSCDVPFGNSDNAGAEDYSDAIDALEEEVASLKNMLVSLTAEINDLQSVETDLGFSQGYLAVTALLEGDGPYSYREFEKMVSTAKENLAHSEYYDGDSFSIEAECIRASLLRAVTVEKVIGCFEELDLLLRSFGQYKTKSCNYDFVHTQYFDGWVLNEDWMEYNHAQMMKADTKQEYARFCEEFSTDYRPLISYEDDFFEEKSLFIIYLVTSNGAESYILTSVNIYSDVLWVQLRKKELPPSVGGGAATGGQLLYVEIPKEDSAGCTSFDATCYN